jgi:hypothetical protein
MTTERQPAASARLIEMDHEEAALKEQLQRLARKKEEAKKNEGERVREELGKDIPDARVMLLRLLRTAQNLDISLEGEYTVSLRRIVKDAGATGISLALVQQVLPEMEKLQEARDQLGKNGTGEIAELKAKEHLREGKGRGLYLVWAGEAPAALEAQDEADGPAEQDDDVQGEHPASTEPSPTKAVKSAPNRR